MTTLLFFFQINKNRICLKRCELSKLLLRWLHLFITLVILHWILYFLRKRKVTGIINFSNDTHPTVTLKLQNWFKRIGEYDMNVCPAQASILSILPRFPHFRCLICVQCTLHIKINQHPPKFTSFVCHYSASLSQMRKIDSRCCCVSFLSRKKFGKTGEIFVISSINLFILSCFLTGSKNWII